MKKINVLSLPGFKSRIDPNSFDNQSLLKDIIQLGLESRKIHIMK